MYSILLKVATSKQPSIWKYLTNSDGSIYAESDKTKVEAKVEGLFQTYPLEDIEVIKNYIITDNISIEEDV